ncbi:class I SAM-dependent methyltransferase [Leptolyngbya sp. AN02str]|uniref:class I SAM-dependent methyltransferase n=1 Tax=Leptolyngbya sp. AN02str TaxID=3423363 RepID=UPI003D318B89
MASSSKSSGGGNLSGFLSTTHSYKGDRWQEQLSAIALRFNKELQRQDFDLPDEVKALPVYEEWTSGLLAAKIASPFWEVSQPKKNQRCLDLGCGVSFLIYPWREWDAYFYGQDISTFARDTLNARGSQLNSKLFKGVQLAPAHQLDYEANQFDVAIATGFSCYYPLDYWKEVMQAVKRVLKPEGVFVFDVLNPDAPLAENWAILETYLGAEVFLESLDAWKALIKESNAKIVKQKPGELFHLFKVQFL